MEKVTKEEVEKAKADYDTAYDVSWEASYDTWPEADAAAMAAEAAAKAKYLKLKEEYERATKEDIDKAKADYDAAKAYTIFHWLELLMMSLVILMLLKLLWINTPN